MGVSNSRRIDNYANYAMADFAWHNKLSTPFLQAYQHQLEVSHISVSDLKMKAK